LASACGVARVISASVVVIASDAGVGALGVVNITRVLTNVGGAGVLVIALAVVHAGRDRRAQVGKVDNTSGRNALVVGTLGVRRDRNRCEDASLDWVARWS
jgi:hypothetical protein